MKLKELQTKINIFNSRILEINNDFINNIKGNILFDTTDTISEFNNTKVDIIVLKDRLNYLHKSLRELEQHLHEGLK